MAYVGRMTELQPELLHHAPQRLEDLDLSPAALEKWAVFLDVDGTLLDIAETPESVAVDPRLAGCLTRLRQRLGGALALVTGRRIDFLDALFPECSFSAAGLHGAEMRLPDGTLRKAEPSPRLAIARSRLEAAAIAWPGVVVEDKGASFAAHFRRAPQFEAQIEATMSSFVADLGSSHTIQRGKSVVEIRPRGHDKGGAVATFMATQPFIGRRPLAIGDDLTDEAMFAAVNKLGGVSVKVGAQEMPTLATARLPDPAAVRAWIERAAGSAA
jgi:trehalose 6-phosphate phosphatase